MHVKMALLLQSKEEEVLAWNNCMSMLKNNMAWVLENLEKLQTFKVSWNNYGRFKKQCPNCLAYNHYDRMWCKNCKNSLKKVRFVTFGVGKPTHL